MKNKRWNLILWALQGLLSLSFLAAGLMKTMQPIAELAKNLPWTTQVPEFLVRFIGLSEFLGGVGLLLPGLLRIKPVLVAVAGAGLATVMGLAVLFHLFRGEAAMAVPAIVLGLLSLLVAWGRTTRAPIAARGER